MPILLLHLWKYIFNWIFSVPRVSYFRLSILAFFAILPILSYLHFWEIVFFECVTFLHEKKGMNFVLTNFLLIVIFFFSPNSANISKSVKLRKMRNFGVFCNFANFELFALVQIPSTKKMRQFIIIIEKYTKNDGNQNINGSTSMHENQFFNPYFLNLEKF